MEMVDGSVVIRPVEAEVERTPEQPVQVVAQKKRGLREWVFARTKGQEKK
jgi:hypothetical protein